MSHILHYIFFIIFFQVCMPDTPVYRIPHDLKRAHAAGTKTFNEALSEYLHTPASVQDVAKSDNEPLVA